LEGSGQAKERLEVILATITGQLTVDQACRRLAVKPSRFYQMRTEILEASLECLEPRPMGRPPHVATAEEARCAELEQQVEQLQAELKLSEVREEIARTMPHMAESHAPGKKTKAIKKKQTRRRPKRAHRPGRRG
jgi:hypothetical protein